MTTLERGSGSGLHVHKRGRRLPGEPMPEPTEEPEPVKPRLPELQFLKRRLPGEPKQGPWK